MVFLIIIVFTYQTNAQITFQIGGGVGYTVPSNAYGGSTVDFYNGTKYGLKPGFNFHGKVRAGLIFINAFGEIGYTTFSNDGQIIPNDPNSSVKVSNKLFSIKLGPEFKFNIAMSPITPYLDAFFSLNTFNGTVEFKGAPYGLPSSEQNISSATRIGAGAGGGVLFKFGGLNLDLSVQYGLLNMTGKEFKGDITKDQRLDSYIFLNDDKDPNYAVGDNAHIISGSRSIETLDFKLSVMFGI
jgi:hypothetical protein